MNAHRFVEALDEWLEAREALSVRPRSPDPDALRELHCRYSRAIDELVEAIDAPSPTGAKENWFPSQRAAYDAGRADALAETEHTIASLRASLTRAEAEREGDRAALRELVECYESFRDEREMLAVERTALTFAKDRLSRASGAQDDPPTGTGRSG